MNFSDNDFVAQFGDPVIYTYYDDLASYLEAQNEMAVAVAISNIKNLMQTNNGMIWQAAHLGEYVENFRVWAEYYNQQSPQTQQILDSL